ncbi:Glycoside hydrolase family 20 [Trypanosoma melophagium]|uniref:Glycoside hydrolase family 20 n=1 Tax=Trypanosoma melophagium TaxID=715481 RepID=UPI00351A2226|nr:Glycoside hydrolase family 20 [Trypanosoma melophagium]KAH9598058.1 Glycoside hydrolase family 20 [Trypanosoma melophagium]KAH9598113.1 Glycoside hydrolase family 20 [Trypanosoma melophagium]KAH9598130.1 Glycoside hydrolase family 20 [Trypanosoma melophagium]KAH9598229.1 Glycoside hydrolase family 20 [Trypanosoma melophagium]
MSARGIALVLLVVAQLLAACVVHAAFPPVWPMPQNYTNGTETVVIDGANMRLFSKCGSSEKLTSSFDRFVKRTFTHRRGEPGEGVRAVSVVAVCVRNVSVPLQLGVSEAYRLSASVDGIMVECEEIYGCYHGLETLSQLISFNYSSRQYELHHAPWRVDDFPRFSHRGVLVDTSRHFYPVPVLKQIIDSLTYAKLNVLHWHITDAHSFPMESKKYPQLAEHGAFSPAERFSIKDMEEVRDYAMARGVRVMMEFDSPAHTAAMCAGMPEICPLPMCADPDRNAWVLDITKQKTYQVVEDLFREITEVFPERMLHVGGDEVVTRCWEKNPYIMTWLSEHNITLREALLNFTKNVEKHLSGRLNRVVVAWEEMWRTFGTRLDKNTVVQQWIERDASRILKDVTSHGYRALVSNEHMWYLDWKGTKWDAAYTFEPCTSLTEKECALVIGGEACQWSEFVDASVALNTMWPRTAAVAERLWSRRDVNSVAAAEGRYVAFRCLLNQRGIGAGPAHNPIARFAPTGPGSCYAQ